MTEQELVEQLADKEHASWARWMEYLFSLCEPARGENGDFLTAAVTIPAARVEHWKREIATPYADLPEHIKQMDRQEVGHILPIILRYVLAVQQELGDTIIRKLRQSFLEGEPFDLEKEIESYADAGDATVSRTVPADEAPRDGIPIDGGAGPSDGPEGPYLRSLL